eukprot:gene6104-7607_t
MKFGKYLESFTNNSTPEWTSQYVQYKFLRKSLKQFKQEIESLQINISELKSIPTSATPILKNSPPALSPGVSGTNTPKKSVSAYNLSDFLTGGGGTTTPSPNTFSPRSNNDSSTLNDNESTTLSSNTSSSALGGVLSSTTLESIKLGGERESNTEGGNEDDGAGVAGTGYSSINMIADSMSRLKEIQDKIISLFMDEAKKVNDFFIAREKEAMDRFDKINIQIPILLKERREREAIENDQMADLISKKESYTIGEKSSSSKKHTIIQVNSDSKDDSNIPSAIVYENDDHHNDLVPTLSITNSKRSNKKNPLSPALETFKGEILQTTVALRKKMKSLPTSIKQDVLQPLEITAKKLIGPTKSQQQKEQLIKEAFKEYYHFLVMLKNFQVINYTAFIKILKKGEKNTGLSLNSQILNYVDTLHFRTSKKVDKLTSTTEKLFSEVFNDGNLRIARKQLRNSEPATNPNTSSFFSGVCLILLWALVFGIDIFIWTKAHVHYSFIFELSKNKLTYHKIFQAVTLLAVLWITSIGVYMWISVDTFPFPFLPAEYNPLVLLVVYLIFLFCPFNIFQLSVRKWFLNTILRVMTAPVKTVRFKDFFMGDQLSSLVLMMVQFSQFICFYTTDVYKAESHAVCISRGRYFNPIISALPAWWRFLQCLRRYYDSRDFVHIRNAIKYFLSILVVIFSTMDSFFSNNSWDSPWRIVWLIFGISNSAYSYWWDIFMDWSILVRSKTHPFKFSLRKKRMYSPVFVYYFALFSNLGFRLTWTFTKSLPQLTTILPSYKLVVVIGVVEILRRGQWNVFRLENEHLNNCDRFRVIKDITLPYFEK